MSWNVIMTRIPPHIQESESTVAAFEKLENFNSFTVFMEYSYEAMQFLLVGILGENNDLIPIILEIKQKV